MCAKEELISDITPPTQRGRDRLGGIFGAAVMLVVRYRRQLPIGIKNEVSRRLVKAVDRTVRSELDKVDNELKKLYHQRK